VAICNGFILPTMNYLSLISRHFMPFSEEKGDVIYPQGVL